MNNWSVSVALLILGIEFNGWTAVAATAVVPPAEPATVSISAPDPAASESGPSTGLLTISRTGSKTDPLTVFYQTSGSAVNGVDYMTLPGSLVIPAGSAAANILVTPVDDAIAEADETVVVTLISPIRPLTPTPTTTTATALTYQIGKPSSAVVTITDNDLGIVTLPTVNIRATDPNAAEPSNPGKITVSRIGDTKDALKVDYQIVTDPLLMPPPLDPASPIVAIPPATSGVDYQALPGSITIPPGAKSIAITIQPIDDQLVEGREHVTLKLKPSQSYNINLPDTATVIIVDNDPANLPPVVSIVTPKDGQTFAAPADIAIAAQASDKDGTIQTVEFFANGKSLGVTKGNPLSASPVNPFQITWKSVAVGSYSLTAKATDDHGAVTTSAPVKIKVTESTPAVVTITANQPQVLESDRTHPGQFTVTRTGSLLTKLNVHYSVGGTGQNGVDYDQLSGAVTIAAGERSAHIDVLPISDKTTEGDETVILTLLQPVFAQTGASVAPPPEEDYVLGSPRTATVTIYEQLPNQLPKVSIVSPKDGAVFNAGVTIKITAEAADADGKIQDVAFFTNDQSIDSVTTSPFTVAWANAAAGQYVLIAKATDDRGGTTASAPIHITVKTVIPGTRLISEGAIWKYLDNGSDQGTAWRAPSFDDSKWASGPAELGYGDGDEATVIGFGPDPTHKFITTYFRHAFNVDNATSYTNLLVRLLRDDGAVVYLNGTEVLRSNMPDGSITYSTLASTTITGTAESTFHLAQVDPKLLVNGVNVVAVEVHQERANSSDISFDLELIGNAQIPAEILPATLVINTPKDGASFVAPAEIVITATAVDPIGYISRVEFFANDQSIGVSQIDFIRAPDAGTPIQHTLDWTRVPEGKYILTAKAKATSGAAITSLPVTVGVSPALTPAPVKPQDLGSGLRVVFEGTIGRHYSIQASSDLVNWAEIGTVHNSTGAFEYQDSQADGVPHRFYRAVPVD